MARKHSNHDLIINSAGDANNPSLRINNASSSTYNHSIESFNSNLTSGETELILVGKEGSTKNSGYIGYYWSGAGSDDNYVGIGHWSANHLLRVYGSGSVVATTNMQAPIFYDYNDTNYYIDAAGTAKVKKIWSGLDQSNTTSPRWDTSFYVAQSQHYYGQTSSQTMYLGESGNIFRLRGTLRVGSDAGADSGMVFTAAGSANATSSLRAPIFYDSDDTSFYINPGHSTLSGYFNGELRTQNGNYVQDFNYRMYAGGGNYYASGTSGWTRVAEVTLNANCQAYYLAGKMWNRNYHEASSYDINICARSECDFTTNNESHFLEFAVSLTGSQFTNYQNRIRAVLIAASTNSRKYEIQFHESAWDENLWQLWSSGGFTVLRDPAAPTSAASGTARLNHVSKISSDSLYANTDTRSPLYYDLDNTAYYTNPAGSSVMNDIGIDDYITHNSDPSSDTYFGFPSNDHFTVVTAGGTGLTIDSNRNATFGAPIWIPDYIYHVGDSNTYFGFNGADQFALVIGGTTRFSSANSGASFNFASHINMNNKDIDYVNQLHFNSNVRFYDESGDSHLVFKWGDTGAGGIKFVDGDGDLQ